MTYAISGVSILHRFCIVEANLPAKFAEPACCRPIC